MNITKAMFASGHLRLKAPLLLTAQLQRPLIPPAQLQSMWTDGHARAKVHLPPTTVSPEMQP